MPLLLLLFTSPRFDLLFLRLFGGSPLPFVFGFLLGLLFGLFLALLFNFLTLPFLFLRAGRSVTHVYTYATYTA